MTARATFKQADLVRVFKAAKAAGIEDVRVDIDPSGKLTVTTGELAEKPEPNPWDDEP